MYRILIIIFFMIFCWESNSQDITVSLNPSNTTYQTVEGFGGGIKRRTENIVGANGVSSTLQNQLYTKAFDELEINMIRVFSTPYIY